MSPFIAIILGEGIAQIQRKNWRLIAGIVLGFVLLAQATFWHAPMTLPEYSSIRLRSGSEFPHLPAAEVVRYISAELTRPNTSIHVHKQLAVRYFSDMYPNQGNWLTDVAIDGKERSLDKLIAYCESNHIDILVLPLVWMDSVRTTLKVSHQVLFDCHFRVKRIFNYLGQPAILVAEFIK